MDEHAGWGGQAGRGQRIHEHLPAVFAEQIAPHLGVHVHICEHVQAISFDLCITNKMSKCPKGVGTWLIRGRATLVPTLNSRGR